MDYPVASPVPREMLKHTTQPVDPRFGYSHDDIVSFNTQCSSQWDGLRMGCFNELLILGHWAHQPTKMYYNGLPHPKIMDGPVELGIESLLQCFISNFRLDEIWRYRWSRCAP